MVAVTLGATSVERHITLDRAMYGSDQAASLEKAGLVRMVRDIRIIDKILGNGKNKSGIRITGSKKIKREACIIMKDAIQEMLLESAETIKKSVQLSNKIEEAIIVICDCIKNGNKVIFLGMVVVPLMHNILLQN